jgi:anti-anti-sigma factor
VPNLAGDPNEVLAIFDNAPALLAEFAGPDLIVVAANARVRSMVADPAATIIGLPAAELTPPFGRPVTEAMRQVYLTGGAANQLEYQALQDIAGDGKLEERIFSLCLTPVSDAGGKVRGVMMIGTDNTGQIQARRAAEADAAAMQERYLAATEVALTLQRNLLPAGLPVLPNTRLAACYLPTSQAMSASGDWFDAFALPDGKTALVVGDVAGRGPDAIAAMSQLRPVLREALLTGCQPQLALAKLDSFAGYSISTRGATACVAVMDPATGELQYSSSGHPPPLICPRDGPVRFLEQAAGGRLGVGAAPPPVATVPVAPGSVVLLYSDGLIKRPGQDTRTVLGQLAAAASAVVREVDAGSSPETAQRVCSMLTERFAPHNCADDVIVLAAHRLPARAEGWSINFPAEPAQLGGMRRGLTRWLRGLAVSTHDVIDTELAVYEAAANAVLHAQPQRQAGLVSVQADLDDTGSIQVAISDSGEWPAERVPGPGTDRPGGRGLALIRRLTDHLGISPGPDGTVVTLRKAVTHPVEVSAAPDSGTLGTPEFTELSTRVRSADPLVIDAVGPVDLRTVHQLAAAILRASAGCTRALVVDLSGVTFMSSDGVRMLYELAGRNASTAGNSWLRLAADASSPARYVLALAGLGQLLDD